MNTGTHDVVNLGWRLAGVLNDWYKPEVLANYHDERHAVAEQLIENDKTISALMSQHKPEKYKHRKEDPITLLDEILTSTTPFTLGLGITYPSNLLNDVQGSWPPIGGIPGHRAPDVLVHKNGFNNLTVRLFEVTKYDGKFHILVFTGDARDTRGSLKKLRRDVDELEPRFEHAIAFRTLIAGTGTAFAEHLGIDQFGDAYWDVGHAAHVKYNISLDRGAIAVLRPDGILGFVAPLEGFNKVAEYLGRLIISREPSKVQTNGANGHIGEMINENENNLYYQQAKQANEQDLPVSMEQGTVRGH